MDRPLRREELRVGLPVAYLGDEEEVLHWGRPPVVGVGHGQHVLVSWSGREDADVSQVVGFSPDETGDFYPGLAAPDE